MNRSEAYQEEFKGYDSAGVVDETTFIAIVAPSMEGKTQSAFTFKHVRPLYFPLSGTDPNSVTCQPVYVNFASLSGMLIKCASKDAYSLPFNVTIKYLKNSNTNKYWTLGFLKALVDNAGKCDSSRNWMEYFAHQDGFNFSKCSLQDLLNVPDGKKNYFEGFCLFLDEFEEGWWNVFLRNLARAAGITCVVCNTNSKICALVGKDTTTGGTNINLGYSLVFSKLNFASLDVLEKSITGFADAIEFIGQSKFVAAEVKTFVNDFVTNQVKWLRPGIAAFFAKDLVKFVRFRLDNEHVCGLGEFLDFICDSLIENLSWRKPKMFFSNQSFLAKIGLLYPDMFYNATAEELTVSDSILNVDKELRLLGNQRSYIEDHLFYVSNPSSYGPKGSKIFCTFVPPSFVESGKHLLVLNSSGRLIPWKHELTFWYPDEILTRLACLMVPIKSTITKLAILHKDLIHFSRSVFASANENAMSNCGNFLEACAAAVICESSRYEHRTRDFSFNGYDGYNLCLNVFINLIESMGFYEVFLSIDDEWLMDELKSIHVPFLTTVNQSILTASQTIAPLCIPSQQIFVDTYKRCANKEEIDGLFHVLLNSKLVNATCECKNYFGTLNSSELRDVLAKSLKASSKFCLIVATKFSENPKLEFADFCREAGINLHRVVRLPPSGNRFCQYQLELLHELSLPPPQDTKMIAILFELQHINKTFP